MRKCYVASSVLLKALLAHAAARARDPHIYIWDPAFWAQFSGLKFEGN
jgi:hypothetical protein